jgi:hypothetical protein
MQLNVPIGRLLAARLDRISLLCAGLIAIGWFGMNTLVATFGHYAQATRFYQLGVVMLHPGALFIGYGSGHALEVAAFATIALLILLAVPVMPLMYAQRQAWLAGWLPLAWMIICALVISASGASGQAQAAAATGSSLHDDLVRLTGHLMQRAQDTLVSHIGIGAGGVLAGLACIALAVRATRMFRMAALRPSSVDGSRSSPPGWPGSALRSAPRSAR